MYNVTLFLDAIKWVLFFKKQYTGIKKNYSYNREYTLDKESSANAKFKKFETLQKFRIDRPNHEKNLLKKSATNKF